MWVGGFCWPRSWDRAWFLSMARWLPSRCRYYRSSTSKLESAARKWEESAVLPGGTISFLMHDTNTAGIYTSSREEREGVSCSSSGHLNSIHLSGETQDVYLD